MSMFTPIDVASGSGSTAWVTYDASAYIPVGAKFVILEAEAAMSGPDSGDIDAHIRIRQTNSSPSYILLRGRAAADGDNAAWSGQGMFPVTNNRTFDYTIESPGFNGGYTLRLVGYIF